MLYAFDLLELNGENLRPLPLGDRKAKLARLLARPPAGIGKSGCRPPGPASWFGSLFAGGAPVKQTHAPMGQDIVSQ
jgi:hypothetical protein